MIVKIILAVVLAVTSVSASAKFESRASVETVSGNLWVAWDPDNRPSEFCEAQCLALDYAFVRDMTNGKPDWAPEKSAIQNDMVRLGTKYSLPDRDIVIVESQSTGKCCLWITYYFVAIFKDGRVAVALNTARSREMDEVVFNREGHNLEFRTKMEVPDRKSGEYRTEESYWIFDMQNVRLIKIGVSNDRSK